MKFHDGSRTMRPDSSVLVPLLVLFVSALNGPSVGEALKAAFVQFFGLPSGPVIWGEVILLNALLILYLAPVFRVHIVCLRSCDPDQAMVDLAMRRLNRLHAYAVALSIGVFVAGSIAIMALESLGGEGFPFLEFPLHCGEAAISGYFVGVILSLQFERRIYEARRTIVSLGASVPLAQRSLFGRVFSILLAIVLLMTLMAFTFAASLFSGAQKGFFAPGVQPAPIFSAPELIYHARQYAGLKNAFYLFFVKFVLLAGLFGQALYHLRHIIGRPLATIREGLEALNAPGARAAVPIDIVHEDEFAPVYRDINALIARQSGQLEVSRKRLEDIIGFADDPIIAFDAEGKIRVFNPAAEAAFRCPGPQALGRDIGDFVEGGRAALEGSGELRVAWRDAGGAPLAMDSHLSGGEGEAWRTAILHDVRKREEIEATLRAARAEAENASRMKSEFLANMSHELRTPLNAILGFTQLLDEDRNLTEAQRERIRVITRSGEHLLSLINDILDISKIEAGRMELHESVFDLREFVRDLGDMFEPRCRRKGLSLYVESLEELPRYVRGDLGKLRQVMINLVGNAVKFTSDGGVGILAGRSEDGSRVRFAVRDTGRGIPEAELSLIMRPFVQASTTDHEGGTGLGLAISSRFIEMMGGRLEAKSALGEGSEFSFSIPLPETDEAPLPDADEGLLVSVDPRAGLRALVVDDQESNRLVLRGMLEPLGFAVDEARDGRAAFESALASAPALVFMDIKMPVLDGYAAVALFKGDPRTRAIPVFALTASAFSHDERRIAEAGFDGFLAKPFKRSSLHALIRDRSGLDLRVEARPEARAEAASGAAARLPGPAEWEAAGEETRRAIEAAADINDFASLAARAVALEGRAPALAAALAEAAASYDEAAVARLLAAARKGAGHGN